MVIFKRSMLVSCLTQVLAYSDLQDNFVVFAHGMHVTTVVVLAFGNQRPKTEADVQGFCDKENWGTKQFILCHLSIGWVDTADLPNNGWLLLCWVGLPRCDYKEFDWELGTCHNYRPTCFVPRFEETIQSSIPTMLNPQITERLFKRTWHPVGWMNSLRIRCTVGIFKQALKAKPSQHSRA